MTESNNHRKFQLYLNMMFNILIVLNILKGTLTIQDDQDGARPRREGWKYWVDIACKREASVKHDTVFAHLKYYV